MSWLAWSYGYSKLAFVLFIMDTQETKEALTPMQELRHKVDKLSLSIDWLKWIAGTGLLGLAGLVTYLHSDTKQDIQEIRTLLIQLIQDTSQRMISKAGNAILVQKIYSFWIYL